MKPKSLVILAGLLILPLVATHARDAASPFSNSKAELVAATSPPPAAGVAQTPGTRTQPVSIQAGTGVLLRLPQPAATVMSAEPSVARVQPASPDTLFLMGVAPGRTTVIATTSTGDAIVQYDVRVTPGAVPSGTAPAASSSEAGPPRPSPASAVAIQSAIAQTVQGGGSVRVRPAGSDVILAGEVPSAIAAQQAEAIARAYVGEKGKVISELTVLGSMQVYVRVRIAEISRQITRELGFNWQALGRGNGWRFGLLTGAATSGVISPLLPLGTLAANGAPTNQLGAGFSSGPWDVNGIIDALAADQLITILAEPNLTAESGETASFLAGGEFPVPVAGSTGANATLSVEFNPYGVSLAIVPTVLTGGRLNLRIRPEVSQLTTTGAVTVPLGLGTVTIPALTVRRAETTVELGSGESFAIAGLLQKTSTDGSNAVPGLGEMPVLGPLFKSTSFQRGESELVIIVTPYLVKPAPSPSLLRAPTDNFRPANDLDRVLFGHQLAPPVGGGPPLDAGFILK